MTCANRGFFSCLLLLTAFSGIESAFAQSRSWELMDELDAEEMDNRPAPPAPEPTAAVSKNEEKQSPEAKPKQRAAIVLGMRKREVQREFGDPDSKREGQGTSIERWNYGNSVIIFEGGVVSVWSDNGDLAVRSLVPRRKRKAFERDDEFALEGWKKVWKKEDTVKIDSRDDVLNDLVSESEN